jgi:uncharacterized protein with HEPN domain
MLDAAMLTIIDEAGVNVLTLTEGLDETEFFATRLTRHEVRRQISTMAGILQSLSEELRTDFAELDWEGWEGVWRLLEAEGESGRHALWFAVRSLVPATLMWLRIYRQSHPQLFACKPAEGLGA